VHITSFTDPSVRTYTKGSAISWDTLTDADSTLSVDQADYFAFKVDDLDRRQAIGGFIAETSRGASYNLSKTADTYLSGLMAAGADSGNQLGSSSVSAGTASQAYDLLVELRTKLVKANVPDMGRWVAVPPELYAVLLHDDRFVRYDASGSTEGLRNGVVGRCAGFDVIEANTVPDDGNATAPATGVFSVIAGHSIATTFAQQISSVESIRLQDTFGDGVKGLHLYGGKVVRPTALATADLTVTA
jgi:hypothetical protein